MTRHVLSAALAIGLFGQPATAGTNFQSMPVGCSWTTEYSNGNVWVETFIGIKDGAYVTQTRDGSAKGPFVAQKHFNAAGLMTKRIWANGKWEGFAPSSCFGEPGSCRYTFTNADGARSVMLNETTRSGKTYKVAGRVKGGARFPDEYFTLGPFNLMLTNKSPTSSARLTKFANCNLAAS